MGHNNLLGIPKQELGTTIPALSPWYKFSTQLAGSGGTNPVKGTPDLDFSMWRRVGDSMEIMWKWKYGSGSGGSAGTGRMLILIPAGYVADTTKLTPGVLMGLGAGYHFDGVTVRSLTPYLYSRTQLSGYSNNDTGGFDADVVPEFFYHATVPIAGWDDI